LFGGYIYGTGVEETPNAEVRMAVGGPTILSGASSVKQLASCVVFDAMGRRVLNPKPGVYFIWEQSAFSSQHSGRSAVGGQRLAVRVRKVILQR
jgi:hypothetical protein